WGAQTAIAQTLGTDFDSAIVMGAGATASSLIVALQRLGVSDVTVVARDLGKATASASLAERLGLTAHVAELGTGTHQADLLVNTLPGSVSLDADVIEDLDAGALFDVVYSPWPTNLAREWSHRGLPATSGLHMLLWQAVRQARVFYGESVDDPLPDESLVVTAMRSAVGL
ncbi:MAG: shikimate dehydrogenase family protein, partial [Microbacteriaceae bacterium]